MTVSSQICKRIYRCNGHTRQWEIDFPFLSVADIHVYVTSPDGTETEIAAGYEIDVLNKWVCYPTVASEQDPLAPGYTLTLVRRTPPTQQITLTQQGVLDAQELEGGYDKLTLLMQETQEQLARSVKYPVSSGKTSADADAFLTQLKEEQTRTLEEALADVSAAQSTLQTALAAETSARQSADTSLAQRVQTLAGTVAQNEAARQSAEEAVQTALTAETTARQNADGALQMALNAKQAQLSAAQLTAVNSGVTASTVAQVQAQQEILAAWDEELAEERPWQRPEEWIDIRAGALSNAVSFLVGHSAPVEKNGVYTIEAYPTFGVRARMDNTVNTYDVYVDGMKVATTPGNTLTTLDWAELYTQGTLLGGHNVMYPAALVTHVVQVTPTDPADKFVQIYMESAETADFGTLWAHMTLTYPVSIFTFARGNSPYHVTCPLLEAFTTMSGTLQVTGMERAFSKCVRLQETPLFTSNNATLKYAFEECRSLKKLRLQNFQLCKSVGAFYNCRALKEIYFDNCVLPFSQTMFTNCNNLERISNASLPGVALDLEGVDQPTNVFAGCAKLAPIALNITGGALVKRLTLGGSSASPVAGIKALTVSNEAPFDSETAPQLNVSYTGLDRAALIHLFKSLPTVTAGQVCSVAGATGATNLTAEDLSIATAKGWTITR